MAANDRTILLQLFGEAHASDYSDVTKEEFFEIYVPFHFLKDYDLDYDDVESGIVDGPNDGGIDAVFCLCDGVPIVDVDIPKVRKNAEIHLAIFSTKFINSFKQNVLDNIRATLADLLDLDDKTFNAKKGTYRSELVDAIAEFRKFFKAVAGRFPRLTVSIVYATASAEPAQAAVDVKLKSITEDIEHQFASAVVQAIAMDARSLLERVQEPADEIRELSLSSTPISETNGPSYVGLANVTSYFKFISLPSGVLNSRLFEDNVRDYEGDVTVNKEIKATLAATDGADFWWLNNGISIICDRATLSGTNLQIQNAKVVNGLQTSYRIHEHFAKIKTPSDDRKLLVRVVCATDEDRRAEIIRATNRQTPISDSQLKTTSAIHKNLETYLKGEGLFYERRKNYWRNQGKKRGEIVSVTEVAQAIVTVVHGRPHIARARPGTLLKSEANSVFDDKIGLDLFAKAIKLVREIEAQIVKVLPACGRRDRNNIKYHVVSKIVAASSGGKFEPATVSVAKIIDEKKRAALIQAVFALYEKEGGTDAVAKSEDFWIKVKKLKLAK